MYTYIPEMVTGYLVKYINKGLSFSNSPYGLSPLTVEMERSRSSIKYRLPVTRERGAIFMIVWNIFYTTSLFSSVSDVFPWKYAAIIEYT